ncbi:DUF4224 domain-containing protein [Leptothrix discophora]|uniref:DUF4224 domain-containing protein n=1 Tax=Leptothrix discophora TaxID=89 RepID=A0ABT9G1Q7_LEPDI|nr:DUF4224 domain-containing protein [Leptothrix discophora]MDP4300383.1 DUF4224 domain-containing protein [Leptothrix discophora]
MTTPPLILTPDELHQLTGYRRATDQLRELHQRGFLRARISRAGPVVLEREHYLAVCRGAQPDPARPQLRLPKAR